MEFKSGHDWILPFSRTLNLSERNIINLEIGLGAPNARHHLHNNILTIRLPIEIAVLSLDNCVTPRSSRLYNPRPRYLAT